MSKKIIYLPCFFITTQVAIEGKLAPVTVDRVANRRKGRNRLVLVGILEKANQRSMAAHAMTENRHTQVRVSMAKVFLNHLMQLDLQITKKLESNYKN